MYFFFLFNTYLDKKRSTSSHVGNKVQRIARSRRAMHFAQWCFFGGRKEASSYWRLVSWVEHKETRKRCVFFFFFPPANVTIFICYFRLLEGARRKPPGTILATPVTIVFLCAVCLKHLGCSGWWSIWWASLSWAGCCMACSWGHRSWLLLRLLGAKCRADGNHIALPLLE